MNNLRIGMSVALLISMAACGTDNETEVQGQTQTEALADSQGGINFTQHSTTPQSKIASIAQ